MLEGVTKTDGIYSFSFNGKAYVLPGVTKIIDDVLPYPNRKANALARVRGTKVHLACALMDGPGLDWQSVHPIIKPRVIAYERFLSGTGFKPTQVEAVVFSSIYLFAGRLDRLGFLGSYLSVLDIKASEAMDPRTELQTAAYAEGVLRTHGVRVSKRFGLLLHDNGKYGLVECKGRSDLQVFAGLAQGWHWAQRKGVMQDG